MMIEESVARYGLRVTRVFPGSEEVGVISKSDVCDVLHRLRAEYGDSVIDSLDMMKGDMDHGTGSGNGP